MSRSCHIRWERLLKDFINQFASEKVKTIDLMDDVAMVAGVVKIKENNLFKHLASKFHNYVKKYINIEEAALDKKKSVKPL